MFAALDLVQNDSVISYPIQYLCLAIDCNLIVYIESKSLFFFFSLVLGHFLQECKCWCSSRYSLPESSSTGSESGRACSSPVSGGGSTECGETGGRPFGSPIPHQGLSGTQRFWKRCLFVSLKILAWNWYISAAFNEFVAWTFNKVRDHCI